MGEALAGGIVVLPFPFSDLSGSKRRPALLLADAGRGDWVCCQITSKAYADDRAIELDLADFQTGQLPVLSYVRPSKLFTAHQSLFLSYPGQLRREKAARVLKSVISLFQSPKT